MSRKNIKKNLIKPTIGIGISSILLIFLVVCFSVFAILALTSAKTDYQMNEKIADSFSQYCKVNQKAQELVAQIDEQLKQSYEEASSEKEYSNVAYQKLSKIEGVEVKKKQITFQVEAENSQNLEVELEIFYPKQTGDSLYKVKKWELNYSATWTPNDKINVYQKHK
jgi:uncharacterized protein YxeA